MDAPHPIPAELSGKSASETLPAGGAGICGHEARPFHLAWRRTSFAILLPLFAFLALFCGHSLFAADKSGVSPNTISLPKGPGSIEGLGESFQPTLNTVARVRRGRSVCQDGLAGPCLARSCGMKADGLPLASKPI